MSGVQLSVLWIFWAWCLAMALIVPKEDVYGPFGIMASLAMAALLRLTDDHYWRKKT